jgi:Tol biopolymer transport system component/DNA-binding winged helix-turn-helix (wHTH) protein
MSLGLNNGGSYIFGEYTFDGADNTLRKGETILPLAPKPLELLRVFIGNQGKLLSKAELMNQLWPDTFVEDSNLAVTIRQLRKALADDAHSPIYIETVARQGYRFVAEVRAKEISEPRRPETTDQRSVRYLLPLAVAAGLLIASISLASLYRRNGASQAAPILAAPFAAQKLSTSGKVRSAALSPDGEKVVYTIRTSAGESVWLREIASGNNVEIIPTTDDDYYNFDFSPDGSTLYLTRGPRTIDDRADLFSVSIFGGVPKKLVSDTRGWISASRDGKLLSFVRCAFREKDNCSLWTANAADGRNERMIVTRPRPLRVGDHEFAPDGKSIVFAVGQSENAASDFGLMSVDLETGAEKQLTRETFFNINSLEILPDNKGLLLTGSRGSTRSYRVWKLDYADGAVLPLTNDSLSYSLISLDESGTRLIATQTTYDFRLVRSGLSDLQRKETLVQPAGRFAFDANGEVIFQSESAGDLEIWRMNADGAGQRQLTNTDGDDGHPIVSSDGPEIFFCSNRSGDMQVWRMKPDGTEQTQVTTRNGGMPLYARDGWVYYQHATDRTLWRVSIEGGVEESVLNRKPYRGPFVLSPTGGRAAFIELRDAKPTLVIASIADGSEAGSFDLVEGKGRFELAWLPDESAVAYTLSDFEDETNTLWLQPIGGGPPSRTADLGDEEIIFLSFTPEKDSIAFTQGRWSHDVVMLSGLQ